ncbi:DUF1318 domain-containing protein [Geobacter pelophilus]|uniref:DUF1318 domain-containing protein n=1 Tax=Geoanaerobacter pelophilus TaxID=60036 RepID=A0AAW4LCR5_9BACT|nr:DUF1318 domain-containing protein [Geoanaerobacter pelophilus]MBT0664961.1 DUF1318 domain-containing protein [Geoanaerobacter pelophilus]
MKILKLLLAGVSGLLVSCAIITVNVYFPEKAVKDAYKSVDEMMLKSGGDKSVPLDKQPGDTNKPPEDKPLSRLFNRIPSFSFVAAAHAAENVADDLAVELAGMPEVSKAYEDMNRNLKRLHELFASGAVGLSSQGLISVKDKAKVTPQDEALVKGENESRKVVITGMAKAILKISKQPVTKAAMDQLLGKSAASYAETKRDEAKPGWWIQLANGRWVQK